MFMRFEAQETRRKRYGSAFLEFAYCKLEKSASIKKKLKIKNLPFWQDDSLYVYFDDLDDFFDEYRKAFVLHGGDIDICGVEYFSVEDTAKFIEILNSEKPIEYQTLVSWLDFAMRNNGFYILGI